MAKEGDKGSMSDLIGKRFRDRFKKCRPGGDGRVLVGEVVSQDDEHVKIRMDDGGVRKFTYDSFSYLFEEE